MKRKLNRFDKWMLMLIAYGGLILFIRNLISSIARNSDYIPNVIILVLWSFYIIFVHRAIKKHSKS